VLQWARGEIFQARNERGIAERPPCLLVIPQPFRHLGRNSGVEEIAPISTITHIDVASASTFDGAC